MPACSDSVFTCANRTSLARAECSQDQISLLERGRMSGCRSGASGRSPRPRCGGRRLRAVAWRISSIACSTRAMHPWPEPFSASSTRLADSARRSRIRYSASADRSTCLPGTSPSRTLLVIELKSELTSVEETLRRARFEGPPCAADRARTVRLGSGRRSLGSSCSRRTRTARRRDRGASRDLSPVPTRIGNAAVKRWLSNPQGEMAGIRLRAQILYYAGTRVRTACIRSGFKDGFRPEH